MIGPEGEIVREGDTVVVRVVNKAYLLTDKAVVGAVCENPAAPEAERIYRKVFKTKTIYFPHEYNRAIQERLVGTDVVVLGMNGYSSLSEENCQAWGVKPGAYEAACTRILITTVQTLQKEYPGVDIRFIHGASGMGVDKSSIWVGKKMNRPQLGFSCPRFMFYVDDEDSVPVYVASTQEEYATAFIKSLDVLIAANGRAQAFQHDIDAAFKFLKHVIFVNVLKALSSTGGPPAINSKGGIEDAVAAFEQRVHLIATRLGYDRSGNDGYKQMLEHLCETVVSISRNLLSPERAFGAEF